MGQHCLKPMARREELAHIQARRSSAVSAQDCWRGSQAELSSQGEFCSTSPRANSLMQASGETKTADSVKPTTPSLCPLDGVPKTSHLEGGGQVPVNISALPAAPSPPSSPSSSLAPLTLPCRAVLLWRSTSANQRSWAGRCQSGSKQ